MVHSSSSSSPTVGPLVSPFFSVPQQLPAQQQQQQQPTKRRSLDTHSPRPPTPPRESPRSKKVPLIPKDPFLTTDANTVVAADAASSISSREASPPSSSADSKPKKRVLWSPWTKYHKPDVPLASTPIRSLIDPKNLKGILKPSPAPLFEDSPFGRPIAAHTFTSFTSMLESIIQALGSTERSKKLDTYITFANTLKAYDEIPDMKAMEDKLPILCGFIRRDLDAKLEDGGNTDSQLIQQAIKFLVILVWTPRLVEAMDDINAAFFLENAILKIEDPATPKIIVNHNLHLLAQQKFPPRIVTAERAGRIITALETLDDRVTGKSITKERIDIYYRLLFQSKAVMLIRVNDWMDNLFGGLLSSVAEVRNRALICVAEVSRVLGRGETLPKTLTNIFSRVVGGKRMFDSIKERLEQFIKDGEGIFVARMWGIVLLLVKSIGEHWEFFTPWLRIIEGCFNVSDKDVKVEAQLAWSKLIYAVGVGPTTTRKLLGLLCKPLEQYIDPRNGHSNTKKPRKAALANVSVLLYYGFRPNATSKQLSEVWDVVVVGLVEKMALSSKDEVAEGVAILSAMFDSTPKLWAETRVLAAPPMGAEDVPRIDPKWVRSNSELVLSTLEVALRRGHWSGEEAGKGVRPLWKRFTNTLADAGSKEIKVSADLMETVAYAFTMFQRIWTLGPPALAGAKEVPPPVLPVSFISKFSYLVLTALESLGTFAFTEKQLAIDDQNKFSPAATPTHKYSSGTSPVVIHPPILHMFSLFLHPSGIFVDDEYYECVRNILLLCVTSQDSRRKKLALLSACVGLLPHRDARELDRGMWRILGQLARRCLPALAREKTMVAPGPVQAEYRDVVKVLEWGCRYELPGWRRLFDEFCEVVGKEQGEGAVASMCVEPLAEVLRHQVLDKDNMASLRKGVMLIEKAGWPKSKAADNPLKTPFGVAGRRASGVDSLEKLYDLIDHLLRKSYTLCAEGLPMTDTMTLVSCVSDLIGRCPAASLLPLLKKTQEGLGMWIIDSSALVAAKGSSNATISLTLCTKTTDALSRLPAHDAKVLDALQVLITSLLQSKRKHVVSAAVAVWNDTFGRQPALYYPRGVRTTLKQLRPIADLSLPTFPETVEEDPVNTPPQFSESQEGGGGAEDMARAWSATPSRLASPFEPRGSPGVVKDTPMGTNMRRGFLVGALGRMPVRLKHMDSQIEFAPIGAGEDEESIDSQVLTERQKEVRARQGEGMVFSGLELAGAEKGKKVGGKDLTSMGLGMDGASDEPDEIEISRIKETQQTPDQNETASFISGMSNRGSYPQFLSTKGDDDEEGSSVARGSLDRLESFEMASPAKADWEDEDGDVDMTESTPADTTTYDSDASLMLSDPPSINDDDFVDAPDHLAGRSQVQPARKKNVKARLMTVTVEVPPRTRVSSTIPPSQTDSEKEAIKSSDASGRSSPDVQIIDEQRASHGLPATPKSVRMKKRAKSGLVQAPLAMPSDILDTIVISGESSTSSYRTRLGRQLEATPSKSKSKLAQETVAESTVEDTPSRNSKKKKQSKGKAVEKVRTTPSRGSKSTKQVQEAPVETTPSKQSPHQLVKFSPPRTRASAKKGVAEVPRFAPLLEPGARKRKFLPADDSSPISDNESRQSSIENVASPTPKRRRGAVKTTPKKRTRSSFTEDIPADPDVSFVGETQLSFGSSSVPGSQFQDLDHVDELVGPTPYAGGKAPVPGIFDDVAEKPEESDDILQDTDVEEVVSAPSRGRRGRRGLSAAGRGLGGPRTAKVSKMVEVEVEVAEPEEGNAEPSTAESIGMVADSMDIEGGPEMEMGVETRSSLDVASGEREVISGAEALGGLRKTLQMLEKTRLTSGECREAENLVFDTFVKLRQRGHDDVASD